MFKLNKKNIIGGIGVILILLIIGAYFLFAGKNSGYSYKTVKATKGNVTKEVMATGTINPVVSVLVGTSVSGTIKNIYADFNSAVKAGQVIAQIDPETFKAQVLQADANLSSAKASLLKAEIALKDAERTLKRTKQLSEDDLVAATEMDTAQSSFDSAKVSYSATEALVKQAEAALELSKVNFNNTTIKSPINGIVITRNIEAGQTVAASMSTPTLFVIGDLSRMQVDTYISEADIGSIKVGDKAGFTVDAFPKKTFEGEVAKIYYSPTNQQNVITYNTIIRVDNPEWLLRPGMTANVTVVVDSRKDALIIPNAAFRVNIKENSPDKKEKGKRIWVLENGKPAARMIEAGISDGRMTEVVSGLKEGEEILISEAGEKKNSSQPFTGPRPHI